MKIRMTVFFLILALCLSLLSGCGVVGEIAGNVADAAMKELENQIKSTVEEYKVDVVEVKSAVGRLNNASDSDLQFFCGVLVRSNSDALPQNGADAVGKLFEQSGIQPQNRSEIESPLLTNKTISFKHTDFSDGDYYLIWVYTSSLTQKLEDLELPTLPAGWLPTEAAKGDVSGIG
jgi:hypothetical protein